MQWIQATIARLKEEDVPGEITERLESLKGIRFSNEKEFVKKMEALFTPGKLKVGTDNQKGGLDFQGRSKADPYIP